MPFVPPLANTFVSSTSSSVPQTGSAQQTTTPQTTTEVTDTITVGIANVKLNPDQQDPSSQAGSQYAPYGQATIYSTNTSTTTQQNIFGAVPPTSVPSLNESFNIPSSINNNVQNQTSVSGVQGANCYFFIHFYSEN